MLYVWFCECCVDYEDLGCLVDVAACLLLGFASGFTWGRVGWFCC